MRPAQLDPLFASITGLKGVGPKVAERVSKLLRSDGASAGDATIWDLLRHLPFRAIDRQRRFEVARTPQGAIVTLDITIDRHDEPPRGSKAPYRVYGFDETGEVVLVFFRGDRRYLEKQLPVGSHRLVSGEADWFNGRLQIVHPDYIVDAAEPEKLPDVEPVYPMTQGLSPKTLQKAVEDALQRVPNLSEWLSASVLQQLVFPEFKDALQAVHKPKTLQDCDLSSSARQRLAYDEMLAAQLAIALVRAKQRKKSGRVRKATGELTRKIEGLLPFSLTPSQQQAITDITGDMAKPERMLRLLQGDVGSGKTIVALMAMSGAVEAGDQACLMAPTDLLARQHAEGLQRLCERVGLRLILLTGKDKEAQKAQARGLIASGDVDIVVGTHALFQQSVSFRRLGLIVVDEQHRFGVHQRMALAERGDAADMLVMTATPIPRTLVLSYYGDMDVSALREKPAGRQPIDTRTVSLDRLDEVVDRIGASVERGDKVYWVCPLVELSDKTELTAAEDRHAHLQSRFGTQVELVHGRMSAAQKDAAMERFRDGEARILVATTVIEVGVDVPDATIMVIEHAERFGLAQLHQLRGRVGRGSKASTCLLLFKGPLGDVAKARLSILRESEDGFRLAEEDLRLRGEGEVLGTRQSGAPSFDFADLEAHAELLTIARDDARYIVATDPDLQSERGEALRMLLYLFGRDQAVRTLRAG